MRIVQAGELTTAQLQKLLTKPSFDDVVLGTGAQEKVRTVFGENLTAVQVVERIVNDVRQRGDAAALYYTEVIDGACLNPADLEVSPAEMEASSGADGSTVDADAGTGRNQCAPFS